MLSDVGLSIMSRDTLSLKNSRHALKSLPSSARDETNEKRKCAIKVTQTKLSSEKFRSINAHMCMPVCSKNIILGFLWPA